MELTKETKLSEILKEYPWMEDEAVKVETYNRVGIVFRTSP